MGSGWRPQSYLAAQPSSSLARQYSLLTCPGRVSLWPSSAG